MYKKQIFNELNTLGVPTRICGRDYIEEAIELILQDNKYKEQIVKLLYPTIAKKYNSTASRVERAMRHAVSAALKNLSEEEAKIYFGNNLSIMTSTEFICLIAKKIQIEEDFNE